MPKKAKVIVAMSGGVDSSTTAWLLKRQGYEVLGVFLRLSQKSDKSESAARRVASYLGIKFYPIDASYQFRKYVIDYFVESYKKGLTPNPCARCNKVIKFGALLALVEQLQGDYLATGHYVKNFEFRISNFETVYRLCRGKDKNKDQSYFLYTLTQEKLKHLLFPMGEYQKTEIKKIASDAGIPHLKNESQDICFLNIEGGMIDHNEFLKEKIKINPGPIKDQGGRKIGRHTGLPFYTIGQRKGVEIGGTGPYYVVRCDYDTNTLYVTAEAYDPALFSDSFKIGDVNWVAGQEPDLPLGCEVVIRYRHQPVKCVVEKPLKSRGGLLKANKKANKNTYTVKLTESERAITQGQSTVFYSDDEVLGGGVIK